MALDRPRSTTDLAGALGVSAGGVSQHLSVLREAGPRARSPRRAGGALPALARRRRPGRSGVARPPVSFAAPWPRRARPPPPSSSPAARRASAAPPRCASPSAGTPVYASARRLESIADLEARRLSPAGARRHRRGLDGRGGPCRVEAEHGAVGALVNNAGYSQSGAVESVPHGRGPPPVRDQRLRPRAHVPARAARDARAARRADRQRLLDGRQLHLPGRRLLPRHQVRGGGDQRRAALRGQGLRRPRLDHPARAHPHQLRRGGGHRGRPTPRPRARTGASTRRSRRGRRTSTPRAPRATSAARPRPWPRPSSARSPRSRRRSATA